MSSFLRTYQPADFETLYKIDQVCYPPGIAYTRRMLRWFLALPGAECLVSEASGEMTGFVLAQLEGATAHLITIDVLEARRRCGVGSALLDAMENLLARRGVRQIDLETATDNHAAIAFWRKRGYRTEAVLRNYYPGKLDAFAMSKTLFAGVHRGPA